MLNYDLLSLEMSGAFVLFNNTSRAAASGVLVVFVSLTNSNLASSAPVRVTLDPSLERVA